MFSLWSVCLSFVNCPKSNTFERKGCSLLNNEKGNGPFRGNENPWVKNLNLNFPTFDLPQNNNNNNNNNFIMKNNTFPNTYNNENNFNIPISGSNINSEYNHYIPEDDKNNRNNDCCCII